MRAQVFTKIADDVCMTSTRNKIAGIALAGALAVGSGIAVTQPADAHDGDRAQHSEQRMQKRLDRLQSKVDDGTISQERADEITARMEQRKARHEERRAARTERRESLASTLGTTADELKADRRAGLSLADIAAANGVDINIVIDEMVADRTARIEEAVASGKIDQAKADQRLAKIEDRITDRINR